jgi:hypothetical protein
MELRERRLRPPAASEPTVPPPGAPLRVEAPVGIGELFARARGLTAERRLQGPGQHWRLLWEPKSLPGGGALSGALAQAVGVFDGGGRHEDLGPLAAAGAEDLLFLDTETLGLGNAGVFLVGCMTLSGDELRVEQLFAQDYSEESAILRAFAERAEGRGVLVSFNGKSFDMPLLICRAGMWQVDMSAAVRLEHVDLLYECRRRWGGELPDSGGGTQRPEAGRRPARLADTGRLPRVRSPRRRPPPRPHPPAQHAGPCGDGADTGRVREMKRMKGRPSSRARAIAIVRLRGRPIRSPQSAIDLTPPPASASARRSGSRRSCCRASGR